MTDKKMSAETVRAEKIDPEKMCSAKMSGKDVHSNDMRSDKVRADNVLSGQAGDEKLGAKKAGMTRLAGYRLLALAVVVELVGSNFLKISHGMTIWWAAALMFICYGCSFALLIWILKVLPLGLTYGVWAGAGTLLTALAGVLIWHEKLTVISALGMLVIVGGVVLMVRGEEKMEQEK